MSPLVADTSPLHPRNRFAERVHRALGELAGGGPHLIGHIERLDDLSLDEQWHAVAIADAGADAMTHLVVTLAEGNWRRERKVIKASDAGAWARAAIFLAHFTCVRLREAAEASESTLDRDAYARGIALLTAHLPFSEADADAMGVAIERDYEADSYDSRFLATEYAFSLIAPPTVISGVEASAQRDPLATQIAYDIAFAGINRRFVTLLDPIGRIGLADE